MLRIADMCNHGYQAVMLHTLVQKCNGIAMQPWLRDKFWRKNWEQDYTECSFKNANPADVTLLPASTCTSSANTLSSTRLVDQRQDSHNTTLVFWKMDFWSMCSFLPGFLMLVFTQQTSSHLRKPHFSRHCIGGDGH